MKIDYNAPGGERRTLENVEGFDYIGATYAGMTEVAVLRVGDEELLATTFTVSDDPEDSQASDAWDELDFNSDNATIPRQVLVVEDDDDVRDLLVHMVTQLGHAVDEARDGVEAIEALAAQPYEFMLLDLTMPRMTGEDVLRWAADHPAWVTGLRVIVVSGRSGIRKLDAQELGVEAVLPKPFARGQLCELIGDARHATGRTASASSEDAGLIGASVPRARC